MISTKDDVIDRLAQQCARCRLNLRRSNRARALCLADEIYDAMDPSEYWISGIKAELEDRQEYD